MMYEACAVMAIAYKSINVNYVETHQETLFKVTPVQSQLLPLPILICSRIFVNGVFLKHQIPEG